MNLRPRIIDIYIARQVLGGAMVALLALLVLFAFIAFVDDLDNVGKGNYSMRNAVEYMALTMPSLAFDLFPLAALIGALMGLGGLAASSELVVIRSAGVSVRRIVMAVLGASLVVVLLAMVVGEFVAPVAERHAERMREVAISNHIKLNTQSGFWVRDGNKFINIKNVELNHQMSNVFVYEFDREMRLRVATHATRARHEDGQWHLEDLSQTRLRDTHVENERIAEATWRVLFEPDLINVVSVNPQSLSIVGLRRYVAYLADNGLDASRFELALWHKFTYPIASAVMIFLAVPMVLGRLKAVGVGQRIVIGVVVGIVFHVLNQAASQMGFVYGLSPALSATLPIVLFLVAGVVMVKRVR